MRTMRRGEAVVLCGSVLAVVAMTAAPAALPAGQCLAGQLRTVGTPATAFAAFAKRATVAYRRPGAPLLKTFPRLTGLGYPTTFAIVGAIVNARCEASWYRVKLPIRPNGAVGYVRAASVDVEEVATRISVDLSRRELVLYRGGRLALKTRVGVGSPSSPTPIGRYYVNQRITIADAGGPFGPAALGVSAFSNVLTDWAEGGPIAIHGTNEPWSIGRAASNGCVRVPNATLERLFVATPAGTPVVIHP
jgi:lipoprotein-anchoring transpeptidase ErfK/SrfK